jgi:hypothetical protein
MTDNQEMDKRDLHRPEPGSQNAQHCRNIPFEGTAKTPVTLVTLAFVFVLACATRRCMLAIVVSANDPRKALSFGSGFCFGSTNRW